ncbi:hypothetical protein ABMA27_014718 [Loxostege sticticalis]|uniref:Uncharacterized protein n=1 Tax=Loxostege sticticalis TaxID=481309 RepID=A0ABR3IA01_LOXSC
MSGALYAQPPLSAAEALSSLLWQPYECRSPPLARSRTDGELASAAALGGGVASASFAPQSPNGGRHARASNRAITPRHEMRLPVPAPAPLRKSDSVSVRVPGEPSRQNVSSVNVNIVQVQDTPSCNVNSAVQTERERSVASAECQTEEPARRRRARRARAPRAPDLLESVPPPPYSTLPPPPHPVPLPVPVAVHPPPAPVIAPHPPAPRFPFQPIPLRFGHASSCGFGESFHVRFRRRRSLKSFVRHHSNYSTYTIKTQSSEVILFCMPPLYITRRTALVGYELALRPISPVPDKVSNSYLTYNAIQIFTKFYQIIYTGEQKLHNAACVLFCGADDLKKVEDQRKVFTSKPNILCVFE